MSVFVADSVGVISIAEPSQATVNRPGFDGGSFPQEDESIFLGACAARLQGEAFVTAEATESVVGESVGTPG